MKSSDIAIASILALTLTEPEQALPIRTLPAHSHKRSARHKHLARIQKVSRRRNRQ